VEAADERVQMHDIGRRRAWVIWVVAMAVYVLAVFHRSSLGVAGLLAAERFGISASQLAFFTVLQLFVYVGMQIPVGVLLDRFGSRRLLLVGLVLMTCGQFAFAFTESFPAAIAARAVIGAGDAMIFVSVLRLVAVWFLVRQAPMVVQFTGLLGQSGAIIAAAPLSIALHQLGWTRTFAGFSSIGILLMVGVALVVKDSPYRSKAPARVKLHALARSVRVIWGNPGTRLGMWSHFTSQFSATVFALLWGFPFLVAGQGLSEGLASTLLMVMTGWVIVMGYVLARLVAAYPFYRSFLVLGIVAVMAVAWAVVLLWPGRSPLWLLVVLVCATASGGPASMVGFDQARTLTPVEAVGRANGLVNIGGFTASLLTMWLIGAILDLREPGGMTAYDLDDFRVALTAQYLLWGLGAVQIVRYRRKAVAHLRRHHPGAAEAMKRGEAFAHLGFGDREGV
jgi:predicted MFS family arabinose efflux permease